MIAELTSGRMLLSAIRVRAAALWAVLNAPLAGENSLSRKRLDQRRHRPVRESASDLQAKPWSGHDPQADHG